jgi:hypothetical protein
MAGVSPDQFMRKRFERFPELDASVMGQQQMAGDGLDDTSSGGGGSSAGGSSGASGSAESGQDEAGLSDVEKLKRALENERRISAEYEKAKKAAERRYEAVKDLDPETYKKAQERAAEAERLAAEAQARETEKLRETEQKYSNKLQEALAERERAIRDLETTRQRYALEKVFLANDGLSVVGEDGVSAFDMFWDRLGGRFKIDPTDGTLGVVDSNGDWELDGESGKRLRPADFISKQRDHQLYSFLFKPKYGSGSGMAPGRDVRTAHGQDLAKMSTQEKFALAYGQKQR